MSGSKLWKILRMEFRLTAANKAFVILTIIGPFLIAAVTALPAVISTRGSRVGIANAAPGFLESLRAPLQRVGMRVIEARGSAQVLDAELLAGSFDGYVILPDDLASASRLEYVSKNVSDPQAVAVLQAVLGQSVLALRLTEAGLPPERVALATQPPVLETRQLALSRDRQNRDFLTVLMTGVTLGMLLYVTVLLYGQTVGRSVLNEKISKTVEIMLSSVRPLELLFGKILGNAAAGMLQYGVWVLTTTLFVRLLGPRLGVSIALGINASTLAFLVLFFLLAFFLYCSLYAALGAASQDEQHLTQLAWPLIMFLAVPLVMISAVIMRPNAPLILGMSLFPLTAPVVMFLRIVVGAAAAWQIVASIAILLAAIAAVIVMSARIFRVGLLMTGKRFRLREVLRWSRW